MRDGRRLKCLTIVDIFSRESLSIEVDTSIPGAAVVEVLNRLCDMRGAPVIFVVDNGPEFTGRALGEWAMAHNIKLAFIRPGKPIENAFIGSFNVRFRDECLNEHWFTTIAHAREVIESWRREYNEYRPHSALGHLAPTEFMRQIDTDLVENTKILVAP